MWKRLVQLFLKVRLSIYSYYITNNANEITISSFKITKRVNEESYETKEQYVVHQENKLAFEDNSNKHLSQPNTIRYPTLRKYKDHRQRNNNYEPREVYKTKRINTIIGNRISNKVNRRPFFLRTLIFHTIRNQKWREWLNYVHKNLKVKTLV